MKDEEEKLKRLSSLRPSPVPTGEPTQPGQPAAPPSRDKEIDQSETKIKSLKKEINELSYKKEKIDYDFNKAYEVVMGVIDKTKISPIYSGYEFDKDGQGVDEFLSNKDKIKKEKINESDIEALRVWAELLSNNYENTNAQNKAEKLCGYIEEYYPENFDVHLSLHNMYRHIIKDKINQWLENEEKNEETEREIQEHRKKIQGHRKTIKSITDYWDKQGLRSYATSIWKQDFSEEDPFVTVILEILKEDDYLKTTNGKK